MVPERWRGVFPAVLLPFKDDYSIDEQGFRRLLNWVASHPGIKGIVVNGHAGEVNALLPEERAEVVRIAASELRGRVTVISGVSAEGTLEAAHHARAVEAAGGDGILLMPPHSWLRFGMQRESPVEFFRGVARAVEIPIIVHQYPKWTKANYSPEVLVQLGKLPTVVAVKMGERDIAQFEFNVRTLRREVPHLALWTCHDEYLLPTLIQGMDGALVGFASFVPDLIPALVQAVWDDNLPEARRIYNRIYELKQAIYRMGEPSASAHARMKEAMYQRGLIPNPAARPPVVPLSDEEKAAIRRGLESVGMLAPTLAAEPRVG